MYPSMFFLLVFDAILCQHVYSLVPHAFVSSRLLSSPLLSDRRGGYDRRGGGGGGGYRDRDDRGGRRDYDDRRGGGRDSYDRRGGGDRRDRY